MGPFLNYCSSGLWGKKLEILKGHDKYNIIRNNSNNLLYLPLQTAFSDSRCGERLRGFVVIQNNDQSSERDTKVLLRQTIILQISFMCQQVYCKAAISILIPFKHLYSRFFPFFYL